MKLNGPALLVLSAAMGSALLGQPFEQRARELEAEGNSARARALLERTVLDRPNDPGILTFYSGFLDRHGDPQARETYRKLLDLPGVGSQRSTCLPATGRQQRSIWRPIARPAEPGFPTCLLRSKGVPRPIGNTLKSRARSNPSRVCPRFRLNWISSTFCQRWAGTS